MKVVLINPSGGGRESGLINGSLIEKNYTLEIAKVINDYLTNKGIKSYLLRDDDTYLSVQERLNLVDELTNEGDNIILVTLSVASGNDSGSEIIYALRNSDNLAFQISREITNIGFNVIKYYQLRNPNDTAVDFYEIIKEPVNTESIIINLGYIDNSFDNKFLLDNVERLGQAIGKGIYNYLEKENVYVVKSGDTLFKIANLYGISVNDLKETNNLTTNNLKVNQELVIPEVDNTLSSDNYLTYVVKPGDSLYKIARNYNTTVKALKEVNNLSSNNLSINQVLIIPNNQLTYVVKSGDSLYRIAKLYNTTVDNLKSINNLKSNNLNIGQVLIIPNSQLTYVVKSGDSLYRIAKLYNTTVDNLKSINNLKNNNLSIGQVLIISN